MDALFAAVASSLEDSSPSGGRRSGVQRSSSGDGSSASASAAMHAALSSQSMSRPSGSPDAASGSRSFIASPNLPRAPLPPTSNEAARGSGGSGRRYFDVPPRRWEALPVQPTAARPGVTTFHPKFRDGAGSTLHSDEEQFLEAVQRDWQSQMRAEKTAIEMARACRSDRLYPVHAGVDRPLSARYLPSPSAQCSRWMKECKCYPPRRFIDAPTRLRSAVKPNALTLNVARRRFASYEAFLRSEVDERSLLPMPADR
jgi:hypothetical protein